MKSLVLSTSLFFTSNLLTGQEMHVTIAIRVDTVVVSLYGWANSHPIVNREPGCNLPEGFEELLNKLSDPIEEIERIHHLETWKFADKNFTISLNHDYGSHFIKYEGSPKSSHIMYDFLFVIFEFDSEGKKELRRFSKSCDNNYIVQ